MLQQEINEFHLRFGLSTLHTWIRFFECCLHLSYKLPIKKWQARSTEEKQIVKDPISSGHDINLDRFKKYAVEVITRFVELYPWYYMPTSVHKIFIHGPEIISSALLPIGQMSEEAQEHSHKYIKSFRKDFSRKFSRTKTMEDVFLRLLLSSDPYISNLKKQPKKKMQKINAGRSTTLNFTYYL
ncbi:uncharacterized protein LOC143348753 [Colletes latitarsis]|uniref:uncharacterized protein LOC143348753 n=1 Tax=Colletes latitarsis TaxID=2605962 RepID=UPI004035CD17